MFTLLREKDEAEDLYTRLLQQGMECYLTDTVTSADRVE